MFRITVRLVGRLGRHQSFPVITLWKHCHLLLLGKFKLHVNLLAIVFQSYCWSGRGYMFLTLCCDHSLALVEGYYCLKGPKLPRITCNFKEMPHFISRKLTIKVHSYKNSLSVMAACTPRQS